MGGTRLCQLKRRLEDYDTPLPKRLCLAKNVNDTRYLPMVAKECTLCEWLKTIEVDKEIISSVLTWWIEDTGRELLGEIIEVLAKFLQMHPSDTKLTERVILFLEQEKVLCELNLHIECSLTIFKTLLTCYKQDRSLKLCQKLLQIIVKVYKNTTKKIDFVTKLVEGETIELLFSFLRDGIREDILHVCQSVLFPITKKGHYATFLQTMIRQESMDELLEEKGDNMRSVLKTMSAFFTFPKNRTSNDECFLTDFLDAFITCYKTESNLIFMFTIMAVTSLNIQQTYLYPAMSIPSIVNDEKVKRKTLLSMLKCIRENEIDLNIKLTEVLGEKLTKVEIKKNFSHFLQATILATIKLEGKPDKTSLHIVTESLKLDPSLIEPKLDLLLPSMMVSKKAKAQEAYTEMLKYLIETLFKLSRGNEFIQKILPNVKVNLEAVNTEQFELKQVFQKENSEKTKSRIIVGADLFPEECVDMFGKLASELTLKQNGEFIVSLQKEIETHCLILLEEGYVSPSLITLSEVLSAILSSVLSYTKIADHTVPAHIAAEFHDNFTLFCDKFLATFGRILLKLSYNTQLTASFLRLCVSCVNLKMIKTRYGHFAPEDKTGLANCVEVYDYSGTLPCLTSAQWQRLAKRVVDHADPVCVDGLNFLLLQNVMVCGLYKNKETESNIKKFTDKLKTHLIRQIAGLWHLIDRYPHYADALFENLDQFQEEDIAKAIVNRLEGEPDSEVVNIRAFRCNRSLQNRIAMEKLKSILKIIEDEDFLKVNNSLRKAIKAGFELETIMKCSSAPEIFENLSKSSSLNDEEQQSAIYASFRVLKTLHVSTLDDNTQLLTIFVSLAVKKMLSNAKATKLKRVVDESLLEIFEMSVRNPNLFTLFPVDYIFDVHNEFLAALALTKLKSRESIVVRSALETAVKKVKTDSELVKNLVNILLHKRLDRVVCMLLPIVAKEKKAITVSKFRSVLAELQEKLHKYLFQSFKNTAFDSDPGEDMSNAMEAYTFTLSKYCEIESEDANKVESLAKSLDFFVKTAISTIQSEQSSCQQVDASVQLLKVVLRSSRKLATQPVFQHKDELLTGIWVCLKRRLFASFGEKEMRSEIAEDLGVTVRCVTELCSVQFFTSHVCVDLADMMALKVPAAMVKEPNTRRQHEVARYLCAALLKSNMLGPKSAALAKSVANTIRKLVLWLRTHYEQHCRQSELNDDANDGKTEKMAVEDVVCDVVACDLDVLTEVIVNAKKISLSYRFLDSIFELHQSASTLASLRVSPASFQRLTAACIAAMNALALHRHELLEDRWPCYLQTYRGVVRAVSERSGTDAVDSAIHHSLAELAHSIEKLTVALCKLKGQVGRLAAYLVADLCSVLERTAPSRGVRQHLENSAVLLIQVSESTHAAAFLRRALAGHPGHMTMINLYSVYKRYHKYVGTS